MAKTEDELLAEEQRQIKKFVDKTAAERAKWPQRLEAPLSDD